VEVVALLLVRSGPWQLAAETRRSGHTPLVLAEEYRRPEAIRALLRPPAAAEEEEGEEQEEQEEPEEDVVTRSGGLAGVLEVLGLRTGATPTAIRAAISAKDGDGYPPIHRALLENKGVGLVWGLLERGGAKQLRAKYSYGWLPIHYAALYSDNAEVVTLLLERGGLGQLRAKDIHGYTPLDLADENDRPEAIIDRLIDPAYP
jgi:hypothetical protein